MDEKAPGVLFKVIAVMSSLAIGGTFVVWKNAEGEKAKEREQAERAEALEEEKAAETTLIVGSKSIGMPVFSKRITREAVDSIIEQRGDGEAELPELLLPSSKSFLIELPEKEVEKTKEEKPQLLPGSKSAPLELIQELLDPQDPK